MYKNMGVPFSAGVQYHKAVRSPIVVKLKRGIRAGYRMSVFVREAQTHRAT